MVNKKNKKKSTYGEKITNGLISIVLGILGFVLFFVIVVALVRWMCRSEGK